MSDNNNKFNLDNLSDLISSFSGNNKFDMSQLSSLLSGIGLNENNKSSNNLQELLGSFLGNKNTGDGFLNNFDFSKLSSMFNGNTSNDDSVVNTNTPFGGMNSDQVNSLLSRTNLSEDKVSNFMDLLDSLRQKNTSQTEQMQQVKDFFKGLMNQKNEK